MEVIPQDIRNYVTPDGREPYEEWVNSCRNRKTRAIIRERVNRLHLGNFGDYKQLTADLYELRIHYGPGYRVYFGGSCKKKVQSAKRNRRGGVSPPAVSKGWETQPLRKSGCCCTLS